jgi:hypothetical protein
MVLLTALLIGSVYVYATGRITNKLSAIEIMKRAWDVVRSLCGHETAGGTSGPLIAATFVPYESKAVRLGQSTAAFSKELLQGLYYVGLAPALLGFWWSLASLRRQVAFWALAIYAAMHSCILIALAMSVHYVSDRHVMPLLLCASFFVVIGLRELTWRALARINASDAAPKWYRSAPVWFAVCLVALLVAALPRSMQRLHGMRAPNHEVGVWLQKRVHPDDVVEDDHAWSAYFSGINFWEGYEPRRPSDNQSVCYIVTTRSREMNYFSKRVATLITENSKVVYTWPENADKDTARVVVRAQPRDFRTHPWPLSDK